MGLYTAMKILLNLLLVEIVFQKDVFKRLFLFKIIFI